MKINTVKLVVGTLSVAAAASVAGSIAGTVAWYQYSTRASVSFVGTSAKCSENLQIRIHDEALPAYVNHAWSTDLLIADVQAYLDAKLTNNVAMGSTFSPVTVLKEGTGIKKDGDFDSVKANPIRQHFAYNAWEDALASDYIVLPLQVKLLDIDGSATGGVYAGHEVYLADLTMVEKEVEGKKDISDALRTHIDSYTGTTDHVYSTWSNLGEDTDTEGFLDLDGDGNLDKALGYEWDNPEVTKYGNGKQTSYGASLAKNSATNPMAIDDSSTLVKDNALVLGETDASGMLNLDVTIWLEGWQKFDRGGNLDAVWDDNDYVGAQFNVGLRFVVDAL